MQELEVTPTACCGACGTFDGVNCVWQAFLGHLSQIDAETAEKSAEAERAAMTALVTA
jgi:hypothetical protein